MKMDSQKAKELLISGGYTCVLCKGETVYTTYKRGVGFLLELLERGTDVRGFSAADKVVGKGAAWLYVLLGIRSVYAGVMSRGAAELLAHYRIPASFENCPDHIINRTGTGICPIEQAVTDCSDPEQALKSIRLTLDRLQSQ